VTAIANGVVVDHEIFGAVDEELARLFGFEEEVAAWDGGHTSGLMVHIFSASDLVVEFPLHTVCVVGLGACATPDAANSNTEGMPLIEVCGLALAA